MKDLHLQLYIYNYERHIQEHNAVKHAYNELPGNRDFPLL